MNIIDGIGMLAGVFTTFSFLPQLAQVWKSRSTRDISLGMYMTFCTGLLLWTVYGLLMHSFPVVVSNLVTLALAFPILMIKLGLLPGWKG